MLACPKFLPVLAVFTMIMFLSFNFLLKSTERLSGAAVFCDKQETLLSTTDNTLTANGELLSEFGQESKTQKCLMQSWKNTRLPQLCPGFDSL